MIQVWEQFPKTSSFESHHIQRLVLGFFDGLHLGHQRVILGYPHLNNEILQQTCLLTFKEHPFSVLHTDKAPNLITSHQHKIHMLNNWGIGYVLAIPFNKAQSRISADAFLKQILHSFPKLKKISVGPNWRFGYKREGTIEKLQLWAQNNKITVNIPQPAIFEDKIISSSRIRQALEGDNLKLASEMLGKPYSLYGKVVEGQKLGRKLGWPTANIDFYQKPIASNGVYAGIANLENRTQFPAAINIGFRPSVSSQKQLVIEAHLLNFDQSIYDQHLELSLMQKLRPEQKFDSLDQLQKTVQEDINKVKKLFSDQKN